ncbi:acyl-CoA synthetase (AMP-forming)/AMP-acid ligase II [Amycolatopsis bartoniae]|uniref:Fatty-acyl-CoA synthase n=1 Tax=Amycolatopsis bartoniae TaxID=941986 RepID=A0A8H9M2L0_9PSEU|nr:AMP-binding protein [Amycolatopsis bartoniae]MBB2940038.1 acyl-CoA synthetase (AMP-forming)/AMP-acid ligase II [Amycolatopsis bartoniae]TVT10003.1 long-chain fatty acid--CoA ligase [Amycolatopsis bartoniae]GHF31835.1 fatty-acyl-CoA synthase [Amycolatopsis bartoniae]
MSHPAGYDPDAYRRVFERTFTYLAGFRRNTHRYAERVALRCPDTGRSWTYAELGATVDTLAAGLVAVGVQPGDVVVYQLYNGPEFAFLYLATQACGAIGAPINFRLAGGETAYVLDDSRPKVYLHDAALTPVARQALELARHRPDVVAAVGGPGVPGSLSLTDLLEAGRGGEPPRPREWIYAETTRMYTSGTTGMPKGVPLNSMAEVLSAHDVIMHFPLTPEDRTLNMTPWFHRGGLYSGGPNPVFYVGAEAVPMRQFDADACLDHVERFGLTFLIGAPVTLGRLAEAQLRRPRDLSTLRGIVTMGAPLEREACLRYQEVLTPRIFNGYGTTEAFWNTFLRPADLPAHAGSAGRACTDDDVAVVRVFEDRLARPDELAAKDGTEVGEVIVRSPKSGHTYFNQAQEREARFHDGWLYIGDLATWDEREYVTIVGRKDDMIISGGENVHPAQVEEILNEHPAVADAAVVGVPDEQWGQLVVAYVVARTPGLSAGECDKHCRDHPMLAGYKRPRAYRFVEALPLTATGKKIHYQVREQAARDAEAGLLERL